jgi:Protein of unknown function (DUF2474)
MRARIDIATTRWGIRLGWLALYWLVGVGTMGVTALGLKWVMAAVGMTA